jgi:hypothetical protein
LSDDNEARDAVLARDNYRCKKCGSGENPQGSSHYSCEDGS